MTYIKFNLIYDLLWLFKCPIKSAILFIKKLIEVFNIYQLSRFK